MQRVRAKDADKKCVNKNVLLDRESRSRVESVRLARNERRERGKRKPTEKDYPAARQSYISYFRFEKRSRHIPSDYERERGHGLIDTEREKEARDKPRDRYDRRFREGKAESAAN